MPVAVIPDSATGTSQDVSSAQAQMSLDGAGEAAPATVSRPVTSEPRTPVQVVLELGRPLSGDPRLSQRNAVVTAQVRCWCD